MRNFLCFLGIHYWNDWYLLNPDRCRLFSDPIHGERECLNCNAIQEKWMVYNGKFYENSK